MESHYETVCKIDGRTGGVYDIVQKCKVCGRERDIGEFDRASNGW